MVDLEATNPEPAFGHMQPKLNLIKTTYNMLNSSLWCSDHICGEGESLWILACFICSTSVHCKAKQSKSRDGLTQLTLAMGWLGPFFSVVISMLAVNSVLLSSSADGPSVWNCSGNLFFTELLGDSWWSHFALESSCLTKIPAVPFKSPDRQASLKLQSHPVCITSLQAWACF